MTALNTIFYDTFQSRSLFKAQQFSTITINSPERSQQWNEWQKVLQQVSSWTDSDVYIVNLQLEGESQGLETDFAVVDPQRLKFIQTSLLAEDFTEELFPLPEGFSPQMVYSIANPQHNPSAIKRYSPTSSSQPDIIQQLFTQQNRAFKGHFNINYMVGEGSLPSVDFDDVLENKVDKRLFAGRSVLIINRPRDLILTPISQIKPVSTSQYYGYLFETVLQKIEVRTLSAWLQLLVLALLIGFTLWVCHFLPGKLKNIILIGFALLSVIASYLLLTMVYIYIPAAELILAIVAANLLVNKKHRAGEQEQLIIGNRVYSQILETNATSSIEVTNQQLLETFCQFTAELIPLATFDLLIKDNKQSYPMRYAENSLQQVDSKALIKETVYRYAIEINGELNCEFFFPIANETTLIEKTERLMRSKEPYLKPILLHLFIEKGEESQNPLETLLLKPNLEQIHEKFKRTTDCFINHYFLLKQNFENLQTASVFYDLSGKLVQTNFSAEDFARYNSIKIFNNSLLNTLVEITGLEIEILQESVLDLLENHEEVIVWPTRMEGLDKNYLVTLSIYANVNSRFGGLLLELVDVEEISYIAKLKNTYVSELNNQLRNDFSEVMLAVDFMNMGIEDGPSLTEVNQKLSKIAGKLHSSDMMLKTINEIMRNKDYPLDLRDLISQAVRANEDRIADKQIALKLKQPRFINLVLVNYQQFAKICKQLIEVAIKDCMDESDLNIKLNELERKGDRFVELIIETKGYGIFENELIEANADYGSSEAFDFKQTQEYISSVGGELEVLSKVGEGATIRVTLPCYRL